MKEFVLALKKEKYSVDVWTVLNVNTGLVLYSDAYYKLLFGYIVKRLVSWVNSNQGYIHSSHLRTGCTSSALPLTCLVINAVLVYSEV